MSINTQVLSTKIKLRFSLYSIAKPIHRLVAIIFALVFLPGCQLTGYLDYEARNLLASHTWQNSSQVTRVPFQLVNNHILLTAEVDGRPYTFLFDSGAGATVIMESRLTHDQPWQKGAAFEASDNTDRSSEIYFVHDLSIKVGEVTLQGLSGVYVPIDSKFGFDGLNSVYFDGVLGQDHLDRFTVEIDYEQQELVLYEPEVFAAKRQQYEGWDKLELEIDGTEPFTWINAIDQDGKSKDVRILVDTGSVADLSLPNSTFKDIKRPQANYATSSFGLGGEKQKIAFVQPGISLGRQKLQDVLVVMPVSPDGSDVIEYGLLGNGILSRFNQVFEYSTNSLYLKPNKRFNQASQPDRSGLTIRAHQDGAMVSTVRGHAAELGISRYDVITSWGGEAITYANFNQFLSALYSDRDSLAICWRSKTQQRCGDLPLLNRL